MRGMLAASRSRGPTMTAPARVSASRVRYFGLARKVISAGPAESIVATPLRGVAASPTASPPRRATISRRVSDATPASLGREGLDDLLGDVDAAAREDRFLQDQVEFLLLGDLVDDARRALLHLGELLVAAHVEVLADFALLALEVAADVGEAPLLVAPGRLRHGDVLALELALQVAAFLLELRQVGVARAELALEDLLRALRGRGFAEDALGIHEADLELLRAGDEGPSEQHQRDEHSHGTRLRRSCPAGTGTARSCPPAAWRSAARSRSAADPPGNPSLPRGRWNSEGRSPACARPHPRRRRSRRRAPGGRSVPCTPASGRASRHCPPRGGCRRGCRR